MEYSFSTEKTCSKQIDFELVDNKIKNVKFHNGCDGSLKAMAVLVENKDAKDVINMLKGINCGKNATSCGDQLAMAIEMALNNQESERIIKY